MDILSIASDMGQNTRIDDLEQLVQDLTHRIEGLEKRLDEQDYYREHNLG